MGLSFFNFLSKFIKYFIFFIFFHFKLHFLVLFGIRADCLDNVFGVLSEEVLVVPVLLQSLKGFPVLPNRLSCFEFCLKNFDLGNVLLCNFKSLLV
jgi:hypothetical protein